MSCVTPYQQLFGKDNTTVLAHARYCPDLAPAVCYKTDGNLKGRKFLNNKGVSEFEEMLRVWHC